MTMPPPSAQRHTNIIKQHRCHKSKRYRTANYSSVIHLLLLILIATSTPTSTSSSEFQCHSIVPVFNDSINFNPRVILDKIKPTSTSVMRAWTCHGRTQKEMVDKLKSVSRYQNICNTQSLILPLTIIIKLIMIRRLASSSHPSTRLLYSPSIEEITFPRIMSTMPTRIHPSPLGMALQFLHHICVSGN